MTRRRLVAIVLLVVAAGLFAVGTGVEKNRHHNEAAKSATGETHTEGGESTGQREAEEAIPHATSTESSEGKILGIDRESTGLVLIAVLASLLLALLLWRRPTRAVWITTGIIAIAFAIFDVAEDMHQIAESAPALVIVATAVAISHLGVGGIAAREVQSSQ